MRVMAVTTGMAVLLTFTVPVVAGPKDDLIAADKAFSALSVVKGNNAAFLATMTDDAQTFGTGGEPIMGKAAAAKEFAKSPSGDPKLNVLSWTPSYAEVSADGTLGYTNGHWKFEGAPDKEGKRPTRTGHYLTVWRKTADGWKYIADIGTTDAVKK